MRGIEETYSLSASAGFQWLPVLRGCAFLGAGFSSFAAEFTGAEALAIGLLRLFGKSYPVSLATHFYQNHSSNSLSNPIALVNSFSSANFIHFLLGSNVVFQYFFKLGRYFDLARTKR